MYEGICSTMNQVDFEVCLQYARLVHVPPPTAAAVAKGLSPVTPSKEPIPRITLSRHDLVAVTCADMDFESVAKHDGGWGYTDAEMRADESCSLWS